MRKIIVLSPIFYFSIFMGYDSIGQAYCCKRKRCFADSDFSYEQVTKKPKNITSSATKRISEACSKIREQLVSVTKDMETWLESVLKSQNKEYALLRVALQQLSYAGNCWILVADQGQNAECLGALYLSGKEILDQAEFFLKKVENQQIKKEWERRIVQPLRKMYTKDEMRDIDVYCNSEMAND